MKDTWEEIRETFARAKRVDSLAEEFSMFRTHLEAIGGSPHMLEDKALTEDFLRLNDLLLDELVGMVRAEFGEEKLMSMDFYTEYYSEGCRKNICPREVN